MSNSTFSRCPISLALFLSTPPALRTNSAFCELQDNMLLMLVRSQIRLLCRSVRQRSTRTRWLFSSLVFSRLRTHAGCSSAKGYQSTAGAFQQTEW